MSASAGLSDGAVLGAFETLVPLVAAAETAWSRESALPGFSVGGLTRHLVSQPECAVEFLTIPPPAGVELVSLADYFDRVDWLAAPVGAPENTSIRDEFDAMAAAGHADSVAVLTGALERFPRAVAAAGPTTYVPWQDCLLDTGDFLVCRLTETLVHADDLAVSLGLSTPPFPAAVLHPVLSLLSVLAVRRHGQDAVLRGLSRRERAAGPTPAF